MYAFDLNHIRHNTNFLTPSYNIEHLKDYWKYLENNIEINSSIGIDATLHSNSEIKKIGELAKKKKSFVKYLDKNPIDDKKNKELLESYVEKSVKTHKEKHIYTLEEYGLDKKSSRRKVYVLVDG